MGETMREALAALTYDWEHDPGIPSCVRDVMVNEVRDILAEHPATPAEEVAEVAVEEWEVLAEALAPSLYEALMEAAHDSWRQWRYLNDRGRERHRARAAEIVADALLPAVAALTAKAKAEAWDEGYQQAGPEAPFPYGKPTPNPYREPR